MPRKNAPQKKLVPGAPQKSKQTKKLGLPYSYMEFSYEYGSPSLDFCGAYGTNFFAGHSCVALCGAVPRKL